jgi:hypothetical protein
MTSSPNLSDAIREDPRAVNLIRSAIKTGQKIYRSPDGRRINFRKEIAAFGHQISSANLCAVVADIREPRKLCQTCRIEKPISDFYRKTNSGDGRQGACRICQTKTNRERLARLSPAPKKPRKLPPEPELVIDLPGIWEVENRGRGYRSFNFTSPIDGSTFTFSSFREARQGRNEMMSAWRQQARYESVYRQSTGCPAPVVKDENENEDL